MNELQSYCHRQCLICGRTRWRVSVLRWHFSVSLYHRISKKTLRHHFSSKRSQLERGGGDSVWQ